MASRYSSGFSGVSAGGYTGSAYGGGYSAAANAAGFRNFSSKSFAGTTSAGGINRRSTVAVGSGSGMRLGSSMGAGSYISGAGGYISGAGANRYGSALYASRGLLGASAGLAGASGVRAPGFSGPGMPISGFGGPGIGVPGARFPGSGVPGIRGPGPVMPGPVIPGVGAPGLFLPPISAVSVNPSLLDPLDLAVDPNLQNVRTLEKDQMKTLNNRFAHFINQVRQLEHQNKMLETKWILLQEQTITRSNIDSMYEAYITNIRRQVDSLTNEKVKLEGELRNMHSVVDEYKTRYEDEINKRATVENEFVLIKKDVDTAYMTKVDLESNVDSLQDQINFLRAVYEEELRELESQIKDTAVVVEIDSNRTLDMEIIVAEVRAQYEEIARTSRASTEEWYQMKFAEIQGTEGKFTEDLRTTKAEMAEITRTITRIQSDIEATKAQNASLELQITATTTRGEEAISEAKIRIKDLEDALQRAKRDMALQVRDYQELMNVKLALDIEIATYRKLLEGEEVRLSTGGIPATLHFQSPGGVYSMGTTAGIGSGSAGIAMAASGGGAALGLGGGVAAGSGILLGGGAAGASGLILGGGGGGGSGLVLGGGAGAASSAAASAGSFGYGRSGMSFGGGTMGVANMSGGLAGTSMVRTF